MNEIIQKEDCAVVEGDDARQHIVQVFHRHPENISICEQEVRIKFNKDE